MSYAIFSLGFLQYLKEKKHINSGENLLNLMYLDGEKVPKARFL